MMKIEILDDQNEEIGKRGINADEQEDKKGNNDRADGTDEKQNEPKAKRQKLDADDGTLVKDSDGEKRAEDGEIATITMEPIQRYYSAWYHVLKRIDRKEMAQSVSVVCRAFNGLCWDRLHGNNVKPHMVEKLVFGGKQKATIIKEQNGKHSWHPIAIDHPPPHYIRGFKCIKFYCLDSEMLDFVHHIRHVLTHIHMTIKSSHRQYQLFFDAINAGHVSFLRLSLAMVSLMELRQNHPGLLENIRTIWLTQISTEDCIEMNELILAKIESGKSFVFKIEYAKKHAVPISAIRKAFHTALQPQSIFIAFDNVPGHIPEDFRLENEQTGEVLALERYGYRSYKLYRCPTGEVDQWQEEANKILSSEDKTEIICWP